MMLARIFFLLLLALPAAIADDIVVITAASFPSESMTQKKLENIFLKKILVNDAGTRWIPLNLSPDNAVRKAFSQYLFQLEPTELEDYWNEQYFQGIEPPFVMGSEEAVLRFVSSTKGAIAYILPCHLDARVQVIYKVKTKDSLSHGCDN
jgi:hypothetical protein